MGVTKWATYRDKDTGLIGDFPRDMAERFPSLEEIDPDTGGCTSCTKKRGRPRKTTTLKDDNG